MAQTDRIFSQHKPETGAFKFDENVARVFDDMISRSIPLYADAQRLIPKLAESLDHDPVKIVDLGCSTGTSLILLARSLQGRNLEMVGVDNSACMLEKCQEKLQALDLQGSVELVHSDIQSFDFSAASIVLMNYTLQFFDLETRPDVLKKIAGSISPGGMLIISEKVCHSDPATDAMLIDLYFDFKRRDGYSELEISRKRDALENVLVPLTVEQNIQMLQDSGFGKVELMLKWFNFATFVARSG